MPPRAPWGVAAKAAREPPPAGLAARAWPGQAISEIWRIPPPSPGGSETRRNPRPETKKGGGSLELPLYSLDEGLVCGFRRAKRSFSQLAASLDSVETFRSP